MKKIVISLSGKSIDKALKELKAYKKWIDEKTKLLIEKLAIVGAQEASIRFAAAMYDGTNDVDIEVSPIENGWVITAKGDAVCFIEYGTGVYHNPSEPYPNPRPAGIVGIGEYGQGKGKRQAWGYYDESGNLVITRGNPASMPLYYCSQEMLARVTQIAREVFGGA